MVAGDRNGELTETEIVHMDSEGGTLANIWKHPREPRDGLALLNEDGVGGRFGRQPFGDGITYKGVDDGLVVLDRRAWTGEGESVFTLTRIRLEKGHLAAVRPRGVGLRVAAFVRPAPWTRARGRAAIAIGAASRHRGSKLHDPSPPGTDS